MVNYYTRCVHVIFQLRENISFFTLIHFDENFSLFQLREEFGYDVNPHDPAFAEKIAEKEREIAKRVKDEKKQKKKDSKEAHMAKMAEESSKSWINFTRNSYSQSNKENAKRFYSVELSGFFCHSDFMWNQFWRIYKL